eukprot:Pgem_evm1s15861
MLEAREKMNEEQKEAIPSELHSILDSLRAYHPARNNSALLLNQLKEMDIIGFVEKQPVCRDSSMFIGSSENLGMTSSIDEMSLAGSFVGSDVSISASAPALNKI